MSRRRGWKSGDWLVMDEESGFTEYGTRCAYDYYGVLKLKTQGDRMHPQDFIRPLDDPYPVWPVHAPLREYDLSESVIGFTIGTTSVPVEDCPALPLFRPGLGDAEIEYDLFVY